MHSYNSDIADVLLIKLVRGSINFLPNLDSKGVNAPNYKKDIYLIFFIEIIFNDNSLLV